MSSGSKTGTAGAEAAPATVWLALGTNMGDRAIQLSRAVAALDDVVHIEQLSSVYETEPFGYSEQPYFWNMVLRGRTDLPPLPLLEELQHIERRLGREPTFRMGPRAIDIDVILYDNAVVDADALRIPHPGLMERAFVLLPLLELDPALRHPATGELLADRADALTADGIVRLGSATTLLHVREGVGS